MKHYSSGMYMRLAFAVAAHLDPEILIVDEVLAVGDAQFQQKCLRQDDDEVEVGRTVLFVSHNTSTIMQVCTRCVLFENGRLIDDGLPQAIVESYISRNRRSPPNASSLRTTHRNLEQGTVRLRSFFVRSWEGVAIQRYDVKERIRFEMEWDVLVSRYPLDVVITLRHESGSCSAYRSTTSTRLGVARSRQLDVTGHIAPSLPIC